MVFKRGCFKFRVKKKGNVISDIEAIYRSNYQKLLSENAWANKCDDLLEAASLLEPMVNKFWENWKEVFTDKSLMKQKYKYLKYLGTYFMLISYAIENLLKAAVIRKKRKEYEKYLKKESALPRDLKTHDLVLLSQKAGINIDSGQEDLLRRLRRSAEWYGRYPVPLHYKALGPEKFKDNKEYLISHFTGDDIKRIKNLINDIKHFLENDE